MKCSIWIDFNEHTAPDSQWTFHDVLDCYLEWQNRHYYLYTIIVHKSVIYWIYCMFMQCTWHMPWFAIYHIVFIVISYYNSLLPFIFFSPFHTIFFSFVWYGLSLFSPPCMEENKNRLLLIQISKYHARLCAV